MLLEIPYYLLVLIKHEFHCHLPLHTGKDEKCLVQLDERYKLA
jgi:hypothetical protein